MPDTSIGLFLDSVICKYTYMYIHLNAHKVLIIQSFSKNTAPARKKFPFLKIHSMKSTSQT